MVYVQATRIFQNRGKKNGKMGMEWGKGGGREIIVELS